MSKDDALKEKIEEMEAETKRDPKHASAWENLGDAYCQGERWDDAIKAYTEAIKLAEQEEAITPEAIKQNPDFCPDLASLYEKRGWAYERKLDFVNATADRKTANKIRIIPAEHRMAYQEHKIDVLQRLSIWGFVASVIGVLFGFTCGISAKVILVVLGLALGIFLESKTEKNNDGKPHQGEKLDFSKLPKG